MTTSDVLLPPPGERGRLDIRDGVVSTIARQAAASVSETHLATGLGRIAAHDLPRARVTVRAGQVHAALTVAAPWPTPVAELAAQVRAAVAEQIGAYTGLTVTGVEVEVHCTTAHVNETRRVQ